MGRHASTSALRWVIGFTVVYLAVACVTSIVLRNWEFVFYVPVVTVIGLLVLHIHRHVRFSTGVLWSLSFWGLLHMLGGLLPIPAWMPIGGEQYVLYNLWVLPYVLKYDHIIHGFGFGITTWIIWQVLRPLITGPKPHIAETVVAVLAANGLGAFNEIIEFFVVHWIPNTNIGGYENTGWDLVSNLVGSIIAALVINYCRPVKIDKALEGVRR